MACVKPLDSGLRRNDGGAEVREFVRNSKGAVGMATNPFPPLSSFRRRPESRRAGRGVKGWQGLSDGTFGCRPRDCHSRCAGMACFNYWIPRPSFPTRLYHLGGCSRRRSTTCIHAGVPSRRIQDFLSINDGAFCSLPPLIASLFFRCLFPPGPTPHARSGPVSRPGWR